MKKRSRQMAVCGMTAALGVVLMVLGSILGLGMYLAPMLAGWLLIPAGREYGIKQQLLLWIAISLLCFMLVTDVEQNMMFAFLFGWYPALRPWLQKLKRPLAILVKLLIFNVLVIAMEWVLMSLLVPEAVPGWMLALLLVIGNLTFIIYDLAIPVFDAVSAHYLKKFFR